MIAVIRFHQKAGGRNNTAHVKWDSPQCVDLVGQVLFPCPVRITLGGRTNLPDCAEIGPYVLVGRILPVVHDVCVAASELLVATQPRRTFLRSYTMRNNCTCSPLEDAFEDVFA